ncbi:hypothetical protein [Brasilonema bromeliae]|uniref:hypothetical protein n=1 Tax=Brasilonema bromeliae TaxID=383615 RepID=UPI00145F8883
MVVARCSFSCNLVETLHVSPALREGFPHVSLLCGEQRLAVNKGAHEAFSRRKRLVLAVRRRQAYPEGASP